MPHRSTVGLERRIVAASVKWRRVWDAETSDRFECGYAAHRLLAELTEKLITTRAANRAWARKHPSKHTFNVMKKVRKRRTRG